MKPAKTVRKWQAVDPEEFIDTVVVMTSPFSADIVTPLFIDTDDHGETVVSCAHIMRMTRTPDDGALGVPFMRVLIPGLCGHYDCGTIHAEVCLN